MPFQASSGAGDPDAKGVFDTCRRLRDPKRPSCTVVEAEEGPGKVVDQTTGDDGADLGCDLRDLETGDEPGQIVGMSPDVPHHQGRGHP